MIAQFTDYDFTAIFTEDSYNFANTTEKRLEATFSEESFGCEFKSDEFVCDFGTGTSSDYEGQYTVTPSEQKQTLYTSSKTLAQNVIVNPIPSNYGKITWDGHTLTVS